MGREAWWDPELTPFTGEYNLPHGGQGVPFRGIRHVHYLDDPALGDLAHGYLVDDRSGLLFVDLQGQVRPLFTAESLRAQIQTRLGRAAEGDLHLGGIAVRPQGSAGTNPWHAVFTCNFKEANIRESAFLFALEADGTARLLAGGDYQREPSVHGAVLVEGPLERMHFGRVHNMAMDRAGNLYLGDRNIIKMVTPGLNVSDVCRSQGRDHQNHNGFDGIFSGVGAMTVDLDTGVLYCLVDMHMVIRLMPLKPGEPEREVTAALYGDALVNFPLVRRSECEAPVPNRFRDLLWHQGRLFICDSLVRNVSVFDTVSGTGHNLVGASGGSLRFGHVALCFPDADPKACASLSRCVALCEGPGNSLMIALEHGLVTIPGGLGLYYPGEEPPGKPKAQDEESKDEVPALSAPPVAPPEVHPSPKVRYAVGEPPPGRRKDTVILRSHEDRPDHSVELFVTTRLGEVYRWAWEVTAGSYVILDSNRIRYLPPADAESGSTFRVTARPAESSSSSSELPVCWEYVLP